MKTISATAGEIRHAIATMECPSFCHWCEQFYDGTCLECDHCNSDDTESWRDMPYHLELEESRVRAKGMKVTKRYSIHRSSSYREAV